MNLLDMLKNLYQDKNTSTEIKSTVGKLIKQLESDKYNLPFDPKGDFQNGGRYFGDDIFPHRDKNDEV